jgi:hypothetical protein
MIITLIGLALLVIGIISAIIRAKVHFKSWKTYDRIEWIQFPALFIGSIITTVSIVIILINASFYDVEYQNMIHKRDMLEYRIEHMEENITGNEMLYNDIVEFNNVLRAEKKWANNPWTNWFGNQDVATIDYIELSGN